MTLLMDMNLTQTTFNGDYLAVAYKDLSWSPFMTPRAQEDSDMPDDASEPQADVMLAEPELAKPPMYAVIMYNDNYTPMDFVVEVLQVEFRHQLEQAVDIMLSIHHTGKGIAGIYPKDIAETKAKKVNSLAHREGYPLLTQIEPYQGD